MSANTGVAPAYSTAFAVAMKVYDGQITSSPGWTPASTSPRCNAVVHEEVATAWRAPTRSANASSKRATIGPWLTHPLFSTSATARTSASSNSGRANGMS
jgi:hypothetical protein